MAAWAMAAIAAMVAAALAIGVFRDARARRPKGRGNAPGEPEARFSEGLANQAAWGLFQGAGEPAAPAQPQGALAARYRLAGVFMVYGIDSDATDGPSKFAILDDVQTGEQLLATESEWAGEVRVARVESEYVLLSDGNHEEMIFLAPSAISGQGGAGNGGGQQLAGAAPTILETNRFGARVGETRWEISRDKLLKYAQEVMDDPQRVSGMYVGMEPVFGDEHEVTGYRLNTSCGEADFYAQVGFRDGDIVRRVNSIRMTSQRRAEFLMSQFFDGQLTTFVFDVERNGEELKLIYLLR